MSGNKSKSKMARRATSSVQLDFTWPRLLLDPRVQHRAEDETGSFTTGHRLFDLDRKPDRLFVPLASEPFNWFTRGQKKWELRKFGRQFTHSHVRVGRSVELRRGYRNKDVLWGTILDVVEAKSFEDFFSKVPFSEVIPGASSVDEAISVAGRILNVGSETHLLGFAIGELR